MNNSGSDILRGVIGGIWIALGSLVLVCGAGCLIAYAAGNDELLWCGVGCVLGGPTLIGAGAAMYYLFQPRNVSAN